MAERLFYRLNRGSHYRRASRYIIRKIMATGAKGAEIITITKNTTNRNKKHILRAGTLIKSQKLNRSRIQKAYMPRKETELQPPKFNVFVYIDTAKKFKNHLKREFFSEDYSIEEEESIL